MNNVVKSIIFILICFSFSNKLISQRPTTSQDFSELDLKYAKSLKKVDKTVHVWGGQFKNHDLSNKTFLKEFNIEHGMAEDFNLERSVFKQDFHCRWFTVKDFDFSRSDFHDFLTFEHVHLEGEINFRFIEVKGNAFLFDCLIDSEIDLAYSKFEGEILNFSGSEINSKISFRQVRLPDKLDLSYCQINSPIDLTYTLPKSDKGTKLNLVGTDPKNIRLSYQDFDLWFPDSIIREVMPGGSAGYSFVDHEDKVFVYENLANKFKGEGLNESLKKVTIEYKTYGYNYKIQNGKWKILNQNLFFNC